MNELGDVLGVLVEEPQQFLPQELSLGATTSRRALESHAVQTGLAVEDLAGVHRALRQAIQRGSDEAFGIATLSWSESGWPRSSLSGD